MNKLTVEGQENSRVLRLNGETREILLGDRSAKLTKKEFEILQKLVAEPSRVFERGDLLESVWGSDVHVTKRTIDAHIVKLRRKMKNLGEHAPGVDTVWALGYRLKS